MTREKKDPSAETKLVEPLTDMLEADLDLKDANRIVDKGLIRMFYQPIVNLANGEIFAYEALCRPRSRRLKSPPDLINAAVRAGRIGELGRQQREVALKNCPDFPLFVNIDPHEFDQGWMVRPDDAFFRHKRPIFLEITETVPIKFFDQCHSVLAELREKGVLLAIDDLGAGFSNLKYIAELEPDIVKLDRELVAGAKSETRQFGLLESITQLCHEMGARVVAEGVETEAELEAVVAAGIDFCQGYLLARPALLPPAVDVARFRFGRRAVAEKAEVAPPEPQDPPAVTPAEPSVDEEQLRREVRGLHTRLQDSERLQHELSRRLNEMNVVNQRLRAETLASAEAPLPESEPAVIADWSPAEGSADSNVDSAAPPRGRAVSFFSAVAAVVAFLALIGLAPMASPPAAVGGELLPANKPAAPAPTSGRAGHSGATQSAVDREAGRIALRVAAWAESWSAQRLHDYFLFYSSDFELPDQLDRESWEAGRRLKIGQPESISVEVDQLEIFFLDDTATVATARFVQFYESDRFRDRVSKTLELVNEGDEWRIRRETSEDT